VKIVTRAAAISNLTAYVGQDLRALAAQHSITTFETGRQNKGWKGLILERLAGLENSNAKAPNGLSFELKSVSFRYVKSELVPKETMAITMINPQELREHSFFESHCWSKLKTIIFCAVMWHGKNSETAELLKVASLDFSETDDLIREIEADYKFIRQKLITHGFESLTGRDGKWIQAHTKGIGHGSTSRAFYARTRLVKKIFEMADASGTFTEKLAA
jgi:DNA mismatch repair protein MutH